MKHPTISILALSALALGGCSEQSRTALEPDQALFSSGKGGGTTTEETDPMTIWDWRSTLADANSTPTLVWGDSGTVSEGNKALVSAGTTGAYEGGHCGVRAKIFWSGTNFGGDAVFDPDLDMKGSKCGPRSIQITLGDAAPSVEAPFMNVFGIMYVPRSNEDQYNPDDSQAYTDGGRLQWLRIINRSDKTCERLQWGTATESTDDEHWRANSPGILVTRLEGSYATRRGGKWEVKTVGSHTATCYAWTGGAYQPTGKSYPLPFRVIITELDSKGI